VAEDPLLNFFDVKKFVTLSLDALLHGLGAILQQREQPIADAARTLISVQHHYVYIETETMTIQFCLECSHEYVFATKPGSRK